MKTYIRFFASILLSLGVAWGSLSEPVSAQAYSNFPYVSDFGTVGAPGADNSLYQFTSDEETDIGWAMEAASDNALYPTYTENMDESYS
ncbi:MAG: hypothetical protein K2O53_04460, partial [Bacteroidales bacterium]|nr:hypothetical protein [Bacteroidales bacterium]